MAGGVSIVLIIPPPLYILHVLCTVNKQICSFYNVWTNMWCILGNVCNCPPNTIYAHDVCLMLSGNPQIVRNYREIECLTVQPEIVNVWHQIHIFLGSYICVVALRCYSFTLLLDLVRLLLSASAKYLLIATLPLIILAHRVECLSVFRLELPAEIVQHTWDTTGIWQ